MGRAVVRVSPEVIRDALTSERLWSVADGLPADSQLVGWSYDPQYHWFNLVFEHPDLPEVKLGDVIPRKMIWMRDPLTPETVRDWAHSDGMRQVWQAWRGGMSFQGREMALEMRAWDTLSEQDRELSAYIALYAVCAFLGFALAQSEIEKLAKGRL